MIRLAPRLSFAFLLLLVGCRDAPDVVLAEARNALTAKDDEAFLRLVEPGAKKLLQAAPQVVTRSGKTFKVLEAGRPTPALLPAGEIVGVTENGKRAVVELKRGGGKARVPMVLVSGQWRIDLLEMDTFWNAARPIE